MSHEPPRSQRGSKVTSKPAGSGMVVPQSKHTPQSGDGNYKLSFVDSKGLIQPVPKSYAGLNFDQVIDLLQEYELFARLNAEEARDNVQRIYEMNEDSGFVSFVSEKLSSPPDPATLSAKVKSAMEFHSKARNEILVVSYTSDEARSKFLINFDVPERNLNDSIRLSNEATRGTWSYMNEVVGGAGVFVEYANYAKTAGAIAAGIATGGGSLAVGSAAAAAYAGGTNLLQQASEVIHDVRDGIDLSEVAFESVQAALSNRVMGKIGARLTKLLLKNPTTASALKKAGINAIVNALTSPASKELDHALRTAYEVAGKKKNFKLDEYLDETLNNITDLEGIVTDVAIGAGTGKISARISAGKPPPTSKPKSAPIAVTHPEPRAPTESKPTQRPVAASHGGKGFKTPAPPTAVPGRRGSGGVPRAASSDTPTVVTKPPHETVTHPEPRAPSTKTVRPTRTKTQKGSRHDEMAPIDRAALRASKRLKTSESLTEGGIRPEDAVLIQEVAKAGYYLQVRPVDKIVIKRQNEGHSPKIVEVKANTVNEADTYLGRSREEEGLVAHFEPTLPDQKVLDRLAKENPKLHEKIMDRYKERDESFRKLKVPLGELVEANKIRIENGLVIDTKNGKAFTGDPDLFDIRVGGKNGESVDFGELPKKLRKKLVKAGVRHGAVGTWGSPGAKEKVPPEMKPKDVDTYGHVVKKHRAPGVDVEGKEFGGVRLISFHPDGKITYEYFDD